jgi:hypothetical protein
MVVSDFMKSYKGACELSFVKWLPMKGLVPTNEVPKNSSEVARKRSTKTPTTFLSMVGDGP